MNGVSPISPVVLYIGGLDRSGSTLLAGMLDQFDVALSVGELPTIWHHGWQDNWQSSDGHYFRDSPFWTAVLDRMRHALPDFSPKDALALSTAITKRRHMIPLRLGVLKRGPTAEEARYIELFEVLYAAIADESGVRLIIDSGKVPAHAALMLRSQTLDFRLAHIVRDPRAIAQSRRRLKMNQNPGAGKTKPMQQHSAVRVAARWILNNSQLAAARRSDRPFALIRYGRLAGQPGPELAELIRALNLPIDPTEAVQRFADKTYEIRPGVAFSGNSQRFDFARTPIRPDDAWKTELPLVSRLVVSTLTAPWRGLL